MKIVCPACDAAYDVPAAVLAAPRKMRCARCGHDWVPTAAAAEPPMEPPAPAAPPPPAVEPVAQHEPAFETEPAPEHAPEPEPAPSPAPPPPPPPPEPAALPEIPSIDVVTPPPKPQLDDLVFTPASFTSFETLPPVIDPLSDDGFEPVPPRLSPMPPPVEPVLKPVPPRAPGDIDPVFMDPSFAQPPGQSPIIIGVLWVVSFIILAAGLAAGLTFRAWIMKHWPESIRLYDWLNLGPSGG